MSWTFPLENVDVEDFSLKILILWIFFLWPFPLSKNVAVDFPLGKHGCREFFPWTVLISLIFVFNKK